MDSRWDWLLSELDHSRLRSRTVIVPTTDFFPASYSGTADEIVDILHRVCGYMDIDSSTVNLSFYEGQHPRFRGEPYSPNSGVYFFEDGCHHIGLEANSLDDPLAVTATIAHEIAHAHLLSDQRISGDEEDHEYVTDLVTIFLGLGVIVANSALQEAYWSEGAVAGWAMRQQGYFTMPMFGYGLALFAWYRDETGSEWERFLRKDVRVPFREALRFITTERDGSTPTTTC